MIVWHLRDFDIVDISQTQSPLQNKQLLLNCTTPQLLYQHLNISTDHSNTTTQLVSKLRSHVSRPVMPPYREMETVR